MDKQTSYANTVHSAAKSLQQHSVIEEAVGRGGHCKNIKGHILEVEYKRKLNRSLSNIIKNRHARLTKSPTATRDDLLLIENGKIIKRFQCKDTTSTSGVADTVKRIENGQYRRTNIVGTKESSELINDSIKKKNINTSSEVQNSGISSKTTELLAYQANGANPLEHLDLIADHAGKSAIGGALIGGGVSAVINGTKLAKGKLEADEAITNVTIDAGKSATAAAVGGAVDVTVTMAVATTPLAPIAKPIGTASGMLAGIATDKTLNYVNNRIDSYYGKSVRDSLYNSNDSYGRLKRQGII